MSGFSRRHGRKVYRLEGPEMLIPRNHARKIWPRFVGAILRGEKAFELRQEDRARFEPGDVLELLEWCPQVEKPALIHI